MEYDHLKEFGVREIGLTAVIPLRQIDDSTSNIKSVILEAVQNGIEIIVVVNRQDSMERLKVLSFFSSIEHARFQVIEDEEESPGQARNIGIKACRTPYITFWDADDIPVVSAVCDLANELSMTPIKRFGIGSYEIIHAGTRETLSRHLLSGEGFSRSALIKNPGIWRWIFKTENAKSFRFQEFAMGEDQDFLADINPKLEEVVVSTAITYKYVSGWENQLTRNKQALDEILLSIIYLANKLDTDTVNDWHKSLLFRQILTAVKRGSWNVKFRVVVLALRAVWKNVK